MRALPNHPPIRHISRTIRESLTNRLSKHLCSFILSILFLVAFITFLLWLALRPHRPRFHVSSFSTSPFPPPESSSPSFKVQMSIRNPNRKISFFLGPISGSVHYRGNPIGSNTNLGGPFDQPPKNTTIVGGRFDGGLIGPFDSSGMQNDLSESGSVGFKVMLKTSLGFRVSAWEPRGAHTMHVSCDVVVGPDGQIIAQSKNRRCSIYFI